MRIATLLLLANAVALADTAIYDVSGYTSTADGIRKFNVLLMDDDGKVLATGAESLLNEHPDARRIDGKGRTLLPGLIDAHAHVYGLGFLNTSLDLAGTPSLAAATAQIAEYAAQNPDRRWILGRGWNQVLWPINAFPGKTDLDAIVDDRPVWLKRVDGHAGWANSAALAIAGIDSGTPDPVGGKIIRDANGNATGVLIDNAMDLVETHVPQPAKAEIRTAYRQAVAYLLSLGMTSVHDAGINLDEAEVYMSMAEDGELGMRIFAMIGGADSVLDAIRTPIRAYGADRLDIAAVKLYADGALGSRGAALLEPYSDDPENRGLLFWSDAELLSMVEKSMAMGFQVAIHAIGDLGNRQALDVFEAAQHGKPSPLRNRIEHAQILAADDVPRFADLGIVASMQPTHATSDMNMAEDRVGPERIKYGYAWRRLLDSGAVLASGSDFPVEQPNPFLGLYAAVTRQDASGQPAGGWYSDQALGRAEALHSFTLAAAYAAGQEDRLGSLEPGKWADFILIDRDYFDIPAAEIDDIRVLETWVGGKLAYASDGGTTP